MKHMVSQDPIVALSREHLWSLVRDIVMYKGHRCDLNHIDVSQITDFSLTFESLPFEGDISRWDVSNAVNMTGLFQRSSFNGDISQWDVRNVKYMSFMFAQSSFAGDISQWQPDRVEYTQSMFLNHPGRDVSRWSMGAVSNMHGMFDTDTLHLHAQPTLYHWYMLLHRGDYLLRKLPCLEDMQQHCHDLETVTQGLSLDTMQAAKLLHHEWSIRAAPHRNFALDLPDLAP